MWGFLLLGLLAGSSRISSTGQQFLARDSGWPAFTPPKANKMAGEFGKYGNPDETVKASSREAPHPMGGIVPGIYFIVNKQSNKFLDAFAVAEGAIGANGEAVMRPSSTSLTQEWMLIPIHHPKGDIEYSLENRATGEKLQPPVVIGGDVTSGKKNGGWKIEGSAKAGYSIQSYKSGDLMAQKAGPAPFLVTLNPVPVEGPPEPAWELELVHSQPPTSDSSLGYMPLLPLAALKIKEGVYAIHDSASGNKLCVYLTPDGGVGDFEAYVSDPACNQEWAVSFSQPEPGNPDAQLAPPPVFEVREEQTGVCLDAYQFGTFGANVRSDEHKIAQRWFFQPVAGAAEEFDIVQASDQRYLGITKFGVGTTIMPHTWKMEFLRGLPGATGMFGACKTSCEGALMCGEMDNGCGGVLDCGACDGAESCTDNVCVCAPYTCEENMCGMVPNGCGNATMDCGGCSDGLVCHAEEMACMPGEELVPVPNISNETLGEPEVTAAPEPVVVTPAPCNCPDCSANVSIANVTAPVVNATPPVSNATASLYERLAPGLLNKLRGLFADAAAESLHDYPVNHTSVRIAANNALTEQAVIAAAEAVQLPANVETELRSRSHFQAEAEFNRTLADKVVELDVIPSFIKDLSLRKNFTQELYDVADPPSFSAAVAAAGKNASAVATKAAVNYVDEYKTLIAAQAYSTVQQATIRIASDVAVNSITYNLDEQIMNGVKFNPADVMNTAHINLKAANTAQAVADEVSGLLAMRAELSKANATNATNATA